MMCREWKHKVHDRLSRFPGESHAAIDFQQISLAVFKWIALSMFLISLVMLF